jgi:hypothetical protein
MAATKPPVQPRDFDPSDVQFFLKDPNSAGGECHSVHRVRGGWIFNGDPVSERTEGALQHRGVGELATFVNDETIAAFLAARAAQGE